MQESLWPPANESAKKGEAPKKPPALPHILPTPPQANQTTLSETVLDGRNHFGALVQKITGRQASPEEIAELYRLQDALNLRDNDALWLVMVLLEHYRARIDAAVNDTLSEAKNTAGGIMEAAKAHFIAQLPAEMTKTARRLTLKSLGYSGSTVASAVLVAALFAVAALGFAAWAAYSAGEGAALKQGLSESKKFPHPPTAAPSAKKP